MNLNNKTFQWLILILLAFIWGSSFIMMKKGLQSFSSFQVAAMRIFISFIFLLPFFIKFIKKINRENIFYLILVGIVGNLIPAFFFTYAQMYINSTLAGMLNSLTPLFTLFVGVAIFRIKTKWLNVIGVIIGLIGAIGLIVKDIDTFFYGENWFGLLIVAATFCYGFNVNLIKEKLNGLTGLEITTLAFVASGPIAGICLLFTDFNAPFQTSQAGLNLFYIILLALFSSVIAVIIMNTLIKYTTALFVSTVTYIIPVFAIMWGFLDGEIFYFHDLLWIIIIFTGVYLVNYKSKLKKWN